MNTYKTICIGCGKEIEFKHYDIGDIAKDIDYEITDSFEAGWWDHGCSCGRVTDFRDIELRVKGDLEGFCCCLESGVEVENFAKLLFREHPNLFKQKGRKCQQEEETGELSPER